MATRPIVRARVPPRSSRRCGIACGSVTWRDTASRDGELALMVGWHSPLLDNNPRGGTGQLAALRAVRGGPKGHWNQHPFSTLLVLLAATLTSSREAPDFFFYAPVLSLPLPGGSRSPLSSPFHRLPRFLFFAVPCWTPDYPLPAPPVISSWNPEPTASRTSYSYYSYCGPQPSAECGVSSYLYSFPSYTSPPATPYPYQAYHARPLPRSYQQPRHPAHVPCRLPHL